MDPDQQAFFYLLKVLKEGYNFGNVLRIYHGEDSGDIFESVLPIYFYQLMYF